jgi:prophage regulatory protein
MTATATALPPADADSYVTKPQLAAKFQVSERTIDNWIRSGIIPKPTRIGRTVRWLRSEIEAVVAKQHGAVA